jgi:hypothetical protein
VAPEIDKLKHKHSIMNEILICSDI